MKQVLLLFLPLCFLFACSPSIKYSVESPKANPSQSDKNSSVVQQDGKCFQKCVVPDRYETVLATFPIYTGSDEDAPLKTETIMVAAAQKHWIKNVDGTTKLEQIPAKYKEIRVLADTFFYRDFRRASFEYLVLAERGGNLRETEVLCTEERTANLFLQISQALKQYGYLPEPTAKWNGRFSQAIEQFQKDSSLPVGDLNLETLQLLGI